MEKCNRGCRQGSDTTRRHKVTRWYNISLTWQREVKNAMPTPEACTTKTSSLLCLPCHPRGSCTTPRGTSVPSGIRPQEEVTARVLGLGTRVELAPWYTNSIDAKSMCFKLFFRKCSLHIWVKLTVLARSARNRQFGFTDGNPLHVQFSNMAGYQVTKLGAGQIKNVAGYQVTKLGAGQIKNVAGYQVTKLGAGQIKNMAEYQVRKLGAGHIKNIHNCFVHVEKPNQTFLVKNYYFYSNDDSGQRNHDTES